MKISLKELVENAKFTQESDLQIILNWFCVNEMESDGLELLPKLAKSQLDKVRNKLEYAQVWIPNMISTNNRYLDLLQQYCMLDKNLKDSIELYEWAKTNVPNMEMPIPYFRATNDYLKKYGISFKESEE